MNPADQPQTRKVLRSTEPPSLWLSLVLGSVLIHLVLFILVSLASTRTAKVELELEPIAVEFVNPDVASVQSVPSRTIAARPGAPSASQPSATQAQPSTPRLQPSAINPSVEQPFVPPPLERKRLPIRTRQPQLQPSRQPVPPTPTPTSRSTQPQPGPSLPPFPQNQNQPSPQASATQPFPSQPPFSPSQGSLPGSQSEPSGNPTPQPSGSQAPIEGKPISQRPEGSSAIVMVSNPRQPSADASAQPAQLIDRQKNVLLSYPTFLASQTVRLQATLIIDKEGHMLDVAKATLLPSSSAAIDETTLVDLAKQIFAQWQFQPAQDTSKGTPVTPPLSNLIVDVEVRLP